MDITSEYIAAIRTAAERDATLAAVMEQFKIEIARVGAAMDRANDLAEMRSELEKSASDNRGRVLGFILDIAKSQAGNLALLVVVLICARSCGVELTIPEFQPAPVGGTHAAGN